MHPHTQIHVECITLSLTSTKYYFFNAHCSFPLTPSFQVPCAQKYCRMVQIAKIFISGKVRSWHSFTKFCRIEYVAMAFLTLGSSWRNLQRAGFRFWSAHRFGVLTAFHHGARVSSLRRMRKAGPFFLLLWPLPVDLTRDKFRLNLWIVKMILRLIFQRIRYGSSEFFLVWLLWDMVADRKKYNVYFKTPLTCALARAHW